MARAKKRKREVIEAPPETPIEEEVPLEPTPPATPPSKKTSTVRPESPSKTVHLKAQRQARLFVEKAKKHIEGNLERANALLEAEYHVFEAKIKSLERAENSKLKPSPSGQLRKAHAAELQLEKARHMHTAHKYDASLDLVAVCEAEIARKDAKVRRLERQLCVATVSVQNGLGADGAQRG
jgi:hypothetical protein